MFLNIKYEDMVHSQYSRQWRMPEVVCYPLSVRLWIDNDLWNSNTCGSKNQENGNMILDLELGENNPQQY